MISEAKNKREAQRRVDRIHAFREELHDLLRAGVLELSGEQRGKLEDHFAGLLSQLSASFDVDVTDSEKRISLGMRILSALGGFAFCAALFLFFYKIWGMLATPVQVVILVGVPVFFLAAVEIVSRRERTPYYTSLLGLVALAAFLLNLMVMASLFNILPSQNAMLVWGALALILAYNYRLRIALVLGLASMGLFAAETAFALSGGYFGYPFERPESFIPAGAVLLAVPLIARHKRLADFQAIYRFFGLAVILLALEVMAHAGRMSYLPYAAPAVEGMYRILGFAVSALSIWLGIRRGWMGIVNLGSIFFAVYLFDRLFSWWWDWMPKYLFFLIMGLIAVCLMAIFRKLRSRAHGKSL